MVGRNFVLLILALLVFQVGLGWVHAQTTTITNFQYPTHAVLQPNGITNPITVTFTVSYTGLPSGDQLTFIILYAGTKTVVTGSGTSAPDSCRSLAGTVYVGLAGCVTYPGSSSGTESVSFSLTFNSTGRYALRAGAVIESNGKVVSGSTTVWDFAISVRDKVVLAVSVPGSVAVAVDGTNQTVGPATLSLTPGSHTISVPQTVALTSGSRLRFDHWSDGSTQTSRVDNLEDDTNLTATYVTQYTLALTDASATGGGWYDQGATAQFSIPSSSKPAPGILGSLGGTQALQGWYENGALVTSGTSGSIAMNAPHTLTVQWVENDTQPYMVLGGLAVIIAILGSVVLVRKEKLKGQREQAKPSVAVAKPTISTGYPDLDGTLEGGIPEGYAVVLLSPSYDERDLLLRRVIDSAISSGKPAFYISADIERTQDLLARYQHGFYAFSPQADKIAPNAPNLYKIPGIENLSEATISLTLAIKQALAKEQATKMVMIIDILSDLLVRYKGITTRRWLTDFVGKRKVEGFTTLATLNPLEGAKEDNQMVIDFFDGVIEIYEKELRERSRRFVIVKKMYGTKYSESELMLDKNKLF